MNAQKIFNTVVTKLLEQGRKSQDHQGKCLYRGPDGLRCAVGFLIPDELYHTDMENKSADDLIHGHHELREKLYDHSELLRDLQIIHDGSATDKDGVFYIKNLKSELRKVANDYSLEIPAVLAL